MRKKITSEKSCFDPINSVKTTVFKFFQKEKFCRKIFPAKLSFSNYVHRESQILKASYSKQSDMVSKVSPRVRFYFTVLYKVSGFGSNVFHVF